MIYDISPLISANIAVFPGDVEFQRRVSMDFSKGHHLNLSSIETTLHLGAHADAPSHYHPEGQSIDQCSLETYLGRCQVIDVSAISGEIPLSILEHHDIMAPRILFKTSSFVNVETWNSDFSFLSPSLVNELAHRKVRLIGIDTPSMDTAASKTLDSHQAFYQNKLAILEGLVLAKVPAGLYYLIALPLKIKEAEASPVRAVLLDQNNFENL